MKTSAARRLYVISDLHLGGRAASESDRGFQMMSNPLVLADFLRRLASNETMGTEVVINGDFVDFLAEDSGTSGEWVPVIEDQRRAAELLHEMATEPSRELRTVFEGLGSLLQAGHTLTVLLGNPRYRAELSASQAQDGRIAGRETRSGIPLHL